VLSLAIAIEWESLGETAVASLIAGVGITLAFSLAVFGSARYSEARREGDGAVATAAAALSLAGLLVAGAGIVAGLLLVVAA
jgi:hypothetical protein